MPQQNPLHPAQPISSQAARKQLQQQKLYTAVIRCPCHAAAGCAPGRSRVCLLLVKGVLSEEQLRVGAHPSGHRALLAVHLVQCCPWH